MVYIQKKKYKINKNGIFPGIVAIILCLFSTTSTLINYIVPYDIVRTFLIMGCLCIEISLVLKSKWTKHSFSVLAQIIIIVIFPVLTINHSAWGKANTLYYVSAVLILILCINGMYNINLSFKFMNIAYVIYGICTILFYFMPVFYKSTIVNLFPDERVRLIRTYNSGCMPGLTSHYSTNGMFLAIGLLISSSKMIANKDEKKKWKYIIQELFFLTALLLTGKRGHLLFSVVGIYIIYSITTFIRDKKGFNALVKISGVILLIVIIGIILVSFFPALSTVFFRFQQAAKEGDLDNGRFVIWERAWEVFKENPFLGIGWKKFSTSYGYGLLAKDRSYDAHNVYLQLLCETGIVGTIIYILWFVKIIKKSIYQMKYLLLDNRLNEQEDFELIFALGYQIFFLLYSITGNPLYEKMTFFPYFLSCGIVLYFERRYMRNKRDV